ncbi:MAG TPA: hypothetical protein DEA28_00315 [Firmicutes bacterium]|nr:hypothetical protein [Bacillota bacterium]
MKNLIIYKSNTGFTKEYAELLTRRIVPAEIVDLKHLKKKMLLEADNIFFGGPIRNNVILGLNKFLKSYEKIKNKNIFIFATGIKPFTSEVKDDVIMANGLDLYHVRLYLLPGGMDLSRMKPIKRKFILLGLKFAAKKEGISEDMILQRFNTPINYVNSSNLDKMVDVYHRVILLNKK